MKYSIQWQVIIQKRRSNRRGGRMGHPAPPYIYTTTCTNFYNFRGFPLESGQPPISILLVYTYSIIFIVYTNSIILIVYTNSIILIVYSYSVFKQYFLLDKSAHSTIIEIIQMVISICLHPTIKTADRLTIIYRWGVLKVQT